MKRYTCADCDNCEPYIESLEEYLEEKPSKKDKRNTGLCGNATVLLSDGVCSAFENKKHKNKGV